MFLLTSMPVGGAETLLGNLVRGMDPNRFLPEICCLKERGPLGDELSGEFPVHAELIRCKFDVTVVGRLSRMMRERQVDAVITVGCGDKMFWGRLAARQAGVPVVASALHSTGWPDGVGMVNRWLTPITDAFIGVARAHGEHLVNREKFPREKVHVIPNGVDTQQFCPWVGDVATRRQQLGLPIAGPIAMIVAALRPEKNHRRFLSAARLVRDVCPDANFVIVGDGPERAGLVEFAAELHLQDCVHFLGNRSDVAQLLQASNVLVLSSDNEAAPVSILEAMSSGLPVVASDVGSISEMILDGRTGFLVPLRPGPFADRIIRLFEHPAQAVRMGAIGRDHVIEHGSLTRMIDGYQNLIESIYRKKRGNGSAVEAKDPAFDSLALASTASSSISPR